MISVLDHIEYLTQKHDCVIVPGFGAFISQYSCKKENGVISALSRSISFNASVDYNDGLLMNSLVRREQIGSEVAKNAINEYVCCIRTQLKHEGEIPIGRLGYFKYVNEDVLEFNPFVSQKANNEFYGLASLTLKPLVDENINEVVLIERKNNIVPFAKKFIQVAASIMLLIGVSLFLSTPIIEQNNTNYANLNAFTIKNHVKEEISQDLHIAIPKIKKNNKIVAEHIQVIEHDIHKEELPESGNYCIVIASLTTKKQAEKFIKDSGIKDCKITKSVKKYRVYVARGTYNEMIELKKAKYSDTDAWVSKI